MVNFFHQCPQTAELTLSREAQDGSLVVEITSLWVMYMVENVLPFPILIYDLGREEGKQTLIFFFIFLY